MGCEPEDGVMWVPVRPTRTSTGFPIEQRGAHMSKGKHLQKAQELKSSKGSLRMEIGVI